MGCCLFCISEHYTLGLRISLQSGNLAQSAGPWTSCPLPEQWRHPGSSSPTHGPPLTTRRVCLKTLPGPPEPNTRGSPPSQDLLSYYHSTWIVDNWSPRDWTMYGQAVRTNNDVEGWYPRLYPTLGCDIQGFGAMGLSVQYWPRWFQDFRRSDWLCHSEQMGPIWEYVPCQKKIFFCVK